MTVHTNVPPVAGRLDIRTDGISRALYSTAACMYQVTPHGVAFPSAETTDDDVRAAIAYASETGISVIARGGGSSLVGQAVGSGLVLDFSRHANRILAIDAARGLVRTQPGITLTSLNDALAPHGLYFPPDPSSGDYCTIGGMIANNSSGARSVKYGSTVDYVVALRCVLADGALVEFEGSEIRGIAGPTALADRIRGEILELLAEARPIVDMHYPKTGKNSSGYRLDSALATDPPDLAKLIVGSEGTLAIVTEATLRVVPRPKAMSMVLLDFDDLECAGAAVFRLLPLNPSAVEIIDRTALDLIRAHRPDLSRWLPETVAAQLFVELDGESKAATEDACHRAVKAAGELAVGHTFAFDSPTHAALMGVRKATLPILYLHPGARRVQAFIEDVCVPPERLPAFIAGLLAIFARHEVTAAVYGHAGQGNLHVRPMLDLKARADVERMERIATETFDLVVAHGGTISGEHGDGRARSFYLRSLYGPAADYFARIKDLFDPAGVLNPGIKVPERAQRIAEHLRFGEDFSLAVGDMRVGIPAEVFEELVERCHGCGTCRTLTRAISMCPVFRATGDEAATPRAKANLLRLLHSGQVSPDIASTAEWKAVLDTCIGCRMCSFECPSRVDVGRFLLEAKARWAESHGQTAAERALSRSDLLSRLGSATAPIANAVASLASVRKVLEFSAGIDARRNPPRFSSDRFSAWHDNNNSQNGNKNRESRNRRAVYFVDQWAEYHDPDVGRALAAVLARLGVDLVVPAQEPCGVAALANGNLGRARDLARRNVERLRPYAEDGLPIISTEPTATLFLRDEYRDLLGDAAESIARAAIDASLYVERLAGVSADAIAFSPVRLRVGYHAPCHLRAMKIGKPSVRLLRMVPGLEVAEIDEGCCGMAGTYGMKRAHYATSMAIGEALVDRLAAAEIDFGATDCSTCKMQMEHGIAMRGSRKRTVHPMKILARALGERMALA